MGTKELNQPTPSYKPEEELITPYLKAKEEWDNRIGSARVQAANWRLCALGLLALCMLLTGGLIYQSSKSSIIPYVIRVDNIGAPNLVGPVTNIKYTPQEREIKYFLGQIIQKTRTLPLDGVVAKQNWVSVYAFMRPMAQQKMNRILNQENPITRLGKETAQIKINSIIPTSKKTYQIRWREDVFDGGGNLKESYTMTGSFTISFSPPKSEEEILVNPLGIYIDDFSWSRDLSGG